MSNIVQAFLWSIWQCRSIATLSITVAGVLVIVGCDRLPTWTYVNNTPLVVDVYRDGGGGPLLRPGEERKSAGGFPSKPDEYHQVYVFKGYEFVPGEGRLLGWDAQGNRVLGGAGDLIFCKAYTWEELKESNLTIVITQNVQEKGLRPDPKTPSCP